MPAATNRPSLVLAACLGILSTPAGAASLAWPGPAPCNGTLQACIDAAASGDTIRLVGTAAIDESVTITNKSLTLRGGRADRRSTFAPLRSVSVAVSGSASPTVVVEDLAFANGGVRMIHNGSAAASLTVRQVRAFRRGGFSGAIDALASGTGQLRTTIENCDLEIDGAAESLEAIWLSGGAPAEHSVRFNRIQIRDNLQRAAILIGGQQSEVRARISGNHIDGRNYNSGILVQDDQIAGTIVADIVSNVIRNQDGNVGAAAAIAIAADSGSIDAWVLHNTVVDNRTGISLRSRRDLGGELVGFVRYNLVAWNTVTGIRIPADYAGDVVNSHNLVHGNGFNEFTPGPGTITAAPRLRTDRFRLLPSSPAIDAAPSGPVSGIPDVDIDGQPRINGPAADIGAFESGGPRHHLHRDTNPSTTNHVSLLDWPEVNGLSGERVLFTPVWNPNGAPAGVYNNHHTGIYFAGSAIQRWAIFNQSFADMPQGASFNLVRPHPGHTFVHTVTAANQTGFTTLIDHPSTNGRPGRFLIASPYWTATYYNAGLAIAYVGPNWVIFNTSSSPLPVGAQFFIHQQDRSQAAFSVVANPINIGSNTAILDHPLLNGRPCAQLQVSQGFGGIRVATPIGVYYEPAIARHAVFTQDLSAMPVGAEFNVWFDPWQVELCTSGELFRDGFEPS
jgi:hypothetical protein